MMLPQLGDQVLYTLTTEDTVTINHRRFQTASGRHGNVPTPGDTYPALVVRLLNPDDPTVNLQVFLDGNDSHHATAVPPGTEPGTYHVR